MALVSRDTALSLVEMHLRTGMPVHPKMHAELCEVIGETTPEEEARMKAQRQAGEAERERYREMTRKFAEAGKRLLDG